MFAIDGKLYAFSMRLYRLLVLNILFVVGCLPIVTIGASLTALISVLHQDKRQIVSSFFEVYRRQLWSTLPYLFFNIMSVIFVYSLRIANTGDSRWMYFVKLCFIFFVLMYNLNLYVTHAYHPKLGTFRTFQYSFFLTIWSFYKTVWLPIAMGLIVWFLYKYIGLVIIGLFFSLPLWLHVRLVNYDVERVEQFFVRVRIFSK